MPLHVAGERGKNTVAGLRNNHGATRVLNQHICRGDGATGQLPPALVARGQHGGREMPCPCLCPCLPLPLPIIIMLSARPDQPLEVEAHSHTLPQPLTASDISVTSQSHPPRVRVRIRCHPCPMHCNLHAAGSARTEVEFERLITKVEEITGLAVNVSSSTLNGNQCHQQDEEACTSTST